MAKFSKRTISLVLTLVMLLSMVCFSGLTASAASTRVTVDTAAGTATYRVLVGTLSDVAYISGAGSTITYDASKYTLVSADVSTAFASCSKSINTSTAGTIKWNVIGDVSYTANTAIFEVTFSVADGVTASADDFVGAGYQLLTNTQANSASTATLITDGTGLVEEVGVPAAEVVEPETITLNEEIAANYAIKTQTLDDGTTIKILIGVMPATKYADFLTIFQNTGLKVLQNSADTAVTSGNIKSGYRVQTADGSDTLYVAVRGDCTASGNCNIMSKTDIIKALKIKVANYANYSKSASSLTACKFYGAATANKATDGSANIMDKTAIIKFLKTKSF